MERKLTPEEHGIANAIDLLVGLGVSYSTSIKRKIAHINPKEDDRKIRQFSDTLWEAASLLANYRVQVFGPVSEAHVNSVSEMFDIGGRRHGDKKENKGS